MKREDSEFKIEDAETVLGMLQRGRGAGFIEALKLPKENVWEMLLKCITIEPRWDSQLESRDCYYASLIIATKMDITPLAEHLKQNDDKDQSG